MIEKMLTVCLLIPTLAIASSTCTLPAPDGGIANPTKSNISGKITKIKNRIIFVRDVKTKKIFQIQIPPTLEIYTAFGGGDDINVLKKNQATKIWLKNCKPPINNKGIAVYFEIFSTDPYDIAPKDYYE